MRRFRTLKVPTRGEPLVRRLYEEMNRQRIGEMDLADRAGVSRETLKQWRSQKRVPRVDCIRACFNVLGLDVDRLRGVVNFDRRKTA